MLLNSRILAQSLSTPFTNTSSNMYKAVVFAALVAVANAGLLGAPVAYSGYAPSAYAPSAYSTGYAAPALVSQQNNILRTPGNLGQVSTYSKTITTPYSSVSKSDVRVSNDALAYPGVAHTYAAPAVAAYAAPAYAKVAAPVAYSGYAPSVYAAPVAHAAVAAPIGVSYSAAPVVSHISFDGIGAHFAY